MEFNSLGFLIFYAIFFAAYWTLRARLKWQNMLLLGASYIFYGWWDWRFLGLIMLTTVTSWGTALLSQGGHRRGWIALNVIVNLCILVVFKYLDFFGRGLARLTAMWGWNIDSFTLDILLPVGISFYTFQAISYSIDVYRRHIPPTRDLATFATFIAFFPQLLAGPIERGRQLLPQISRHRRWDYDMAVDGVREALWGLFKKVAVADMCGLYVDAIYSDHNASPKVLSVAAILFMLQIYCDFSGYCNMARGLSAMLGIRLSVNFRYPLFSRNPTEFWHRWHISLMTWFRDYVYIPLGGSRNGRFATCRNILVVFLLSGLWHGASLNYIAWGALWGMIMILSRISHQRRYYPASTPSSTATDLLKIFATSYIATLVFITFRIDDITYAVTTIERSWWIIALMFIMLWGAALLYSRIGPVLFAIIGCVAITLIIPAWETLSPGPAIAMAVKGIYPASITGMLMTEWYGRRRAFALERMSIRPRHTRILIYWVIILAILLSNTTGQHFIYYQF